jgi:hypothetical protein
MEGEEEYKRKERKSESDVSDLNAIVHVRKVQQVDSPRPLPDLLHTILQVQLMTSSILASLYTQRYARAGAVNLVQFARRRCYHALWAHASSVWVP